MEAQNTGRFLTLDEAAAMLQVSKRTLNRLIRRREMPGLKVGAQWRIPENGFLKWVEERAVAHSHNDGSEKQ
jgi:excisionase family DNA binding protein